MSEPGEEGRKPSLAETIEALPLRLEAERTTLGQLLAVLGDHATALVLLVFSIPAIIPTPGIPAGFVFGTALALLAVQLVIGADRFFLPARLARVNVPHRLLEAMAVRLGPKLGKLETWLKPRWKMLSGKRALRPLGLFIFVMAVLIALPIPFGNVLPGLAIFFIALGLAQRDGLAIGGGLFFGVAAMAFSAFILLGGWWLISDWLGWSSGPSAGV
ncbi:exopolysaccharide biosynthesis protein [Rhizobium sp. SGZ-381]|uniref:exopolysaccharide biosynthesis protein n=1 Tax=Rhizobium sp. SGZ-381 TaxID=3342800 RepID=UPI00366C0B50